MERPKIEQYPHDVRPSTLFAGRVAERCGSRAFDLSPDGRTLAVAANTPESGAAVHLIDVATGRRRELHAVDEGTQRIRARDVLFAADGRSVVYAVAGVVRRVDVDSGEATVIDRHPFRHDVVAQRTALATDAARRRLAIRTPERRVRVLDEHDTTIAEIEPETVRASDVALSASGRLLALGDNANSGVEVWDVDSGARVARMAFPFPEYSEEWMSVNRLGFHPDQELLVAKTSHARGPFAASIATGESVWRPAHSGEAPPKCRAWTFSPDGSRLALWAPADREGQGRHAVPTVLAFHDPKTFAHLSEVDAGPGTWGVETLVTDYRMVYSADGTRLACGADDGRITVFAV